MKQNKLNQYLRKENLAKGIILFIFFCILFYFAFYGFNETSLAKNESCKKVYYSNTTNSNYFYECNSSYENFGFKFYYLLYSLVLIISISFLGGAIYYLFYAK